MQLAGYRSHQATRREDEDELALRIREMESGLARLSPDQMDRPNLEAYLDAARGNLAVLRARRTGEDLTAADFPPAAPLDEVRRQLGTVPENARIDRLGDVGLARATRAMLARDHRGTIEALALIEEAMDLLEPDDERWFRNAGTLGMAHCMLAMNAIAPPADCPTTWTRASPGCGTLSS